MALKVVHDGSADGDVQERCCMCRAKTRFWYDPKDVAMCEPCAKKTKHEDVPSKAEWCEKEHRLDPQLSRPYGWR